LLFVAYRRWRWLHRQVEIVAEQKTIAVNSVTVSANALATNREIEHAHTGVRDTEAYVSLEPNGSWVPPGTERIGVGFTLEIANTGRTPGDRLGGFFGYLIAPTPGIPDITRTICPV
jgi:hypothetical protein